MDKNILAKIYEKPEYLEYLRYHPKWYYYLDSDPKNYKKFEETVKKELKITTYDRLEKVKGQINFFSSVFNYFSK